MVPDPEDAIAFNNGGKARHVQGDLEGAIADYSEAIRLDPDDADSFYNRGVTRRDQGDLDAAMRDLHQAVRLSPTREDFRRSLDEVRRQT